MKKKYALWANIVFIVACAAIVAFLLRAPEETTPKLPQDDIHYQYFIIESKKEAETFCRDCHSPGKKNPLSENHPPEYRCLFCHKRGS
jgi:hypothetical protein